MASPGPPPSPHHNDPHHNDHKDCLNAQKIEGLTLQIKHRMRPPPSPHHNDHKDNYSGSDPVSSYMSYDKYLKPKYRTFKKVTFAIQSFDLFECTTD